MADPKSIAEAISRDMRAVAEPDSHFHFDFSQFIPGFAGSEDAVGRLMGLDVCRDARSVFVTPDNGLMPLRRRLLEAGHDIVMPSYFLHSGFMLIEAAKVPAGQEIFASWLDGLNHFGRPVSLAELRQRGGFDLIVAGASAVATNGVRFGMGAIYLDVEWGVFAEAGLVSQATTIATIVHDLQVTDDPVPAPPTHVPVDLIATPTRLLHAPRRPRPAGLDWSIVDSALSDAPPLKELRSISG